MSCPRTDHLLQEFFSDDLAPLVRNELESHVAQCAHCKSEIEALLLAQESLNQWQDERVPHWDRGVELFRREHRSPREQPLVWRWWQWAPTGASFAMLMLMMFNVTVYSGEQGVSISFGGNGAGEIERQLSSFEEEQRDEMQALVERFEDRQDSNNVQLLQAVMDQTQQTTSENLERMYAYFEQQRLQDLQDMRVGYQELVDNDYETIRSLQQLAQFVSYQDDQR